MFGIRFDHARVKRSSGTVIFLPPSKGKPRWLEDVKGSLLDRFDVVTLRSALPAHGQIDSYSSKLIDKLADAGVRRVTVVGVGGGGALAQNLAVEFPTVVRRLVLLNATARVSPGLRTRLMDRVEKFLPLGLPLRAAGDDFDARPVLHRVRCPVIVGLSADAPAYEQAQATYLTRVIPSAWYVALPREDRPKEFAAGLIDSFDEFLTVPGRRPQKSLKVSSAA